MARALPETLRELIGFGGIVLVKCRKCGRIAKFSPYTLSTWFRRNGGRDDWRTIRRKFICEGLGEGCGSRDVEVTYMLDAPEPPPRPPTPKDVPKCPDGIDPDRWAKADHYERKRLIRRLR